MKYKVFTGIMLALLLIGMLALVFNVQPATASLRAHNINTGLNYATIQEALNAPETLNGHTIFVEEGTYYENIVIAKSISLIGENRSTTVIDGRGSGNVINIAASNVKVAGFTMRNGTYGIIIQYFDYNIISGNIVKNNEVGISLGAATNNKIYHNSFINNTQHVYFRTSSYTNSWDNGYPSGGNYWSNYTGVDVKNGPNQDQPGSDGIGDTPYIINENNRDRYPLMDPIAAQERWAIIEDVHRDQLKVETTDDEVWAELVQLYKNGSQRWIGGIVEKYVNEWGFRFNPETILVAEITIEAWQTTIRGISENLDYWLGNMAVVGARVIHISQPVGGIAISVNKFALLAPYIGLTTLLAVAVITVGYVKKRKRNTKIIS
ncbi:MAG: NosD domain-containing protein [Candidatus Bathyarchaeaceae archaeon]